MPSVQTMAADDEPDDDERQVGAGHGHGEEHDFAEPVGDRREPRVDCLVDGHVLLRLP
jgi:hypothetical protein